MLIKNDVLISAASYKKDINFDGHPKQIFGPSYSVRALDTFIWIDMFIQQVRVCYISSLASPMLNLHATN